MSDSIVEITLLSRERGVSAEWKPKPTAIIIGVTKAQDVHQKLCIVHSKAPDSSITVYKDVAEDYSDVLITDSQLPVLFGVEFSGGVLLLEEWFEGLSSHPEHFAGKEPAYGKMVQDKVLLLEVEFVSTRRTSAVYRPAGGIAMPAGVTSDKPRRTACGMDATVNNDLNGHFRVGVAMWGTPDEAGSWELLKSKKCWQPGVTLAAGYAFTCIARDYPKQEASLQRVIYPAMARKKISNRCSNRARDLATKPEKFTAKCRESYESIANKWQEGIGAWVAAGNKGVPPELQYLYDIGLKGLPAAYKYLKELKQAKKEKKKLAQAAGGDAAPEEGSPEGGEDAFDELAAVDEQAKQVQALLQLMEPQEEEEEEEGAGGDAPAAQAPKATGGRPTRAHKGKRKAGADKQESAEEGKGKKKSKSKGKQDGDE